MEKIWFLSLLFILFCESLDPFVSQSCFLRQDFILSEIHGEFKEKLSERFYLCGLYLSIQ